MSRYSYWPLLKTALTKTYCVSKFDDVQCLSASERLSDKDECSYASLHCSGKLPTEKLILLGQSKFGDLPCS